MALHLSSAPLEKRKYKRVRNGHTVTVRTDTGESMTLDVMDYSLGGIGLVSKTPLPIGSCIEVESIKTVDGIHRRLDLRGEVRHGQEQYQEYCFGIAFV